jgi:hypothetical protein
LSAAAARGQVNATMIKAAIGQELLVALPGKRARSRRLRCTLNYQKSCCRRVLINLHLYAGTVNSR